jgi:hypothetical protein
MIVQEAFFGPVTTKSVDNTETEIVHSTGTGIAQHLIANAPRRQTSFLLHSSRQSRVVTSHAAAQHAPHSFLHTVFIPPHRLHSCNPAETGRASGATPATAGTGNSCAVATVAEGGCMRAREYSGTGAC